MSQDHNNYNYNVETCLSWLIKMLHVCFVAMYFSMIWLYHCKIIYAMQYNGWESLVCFAGLLNYLSLAERKRRLGVVR